MFEKAAAVYFSPTGGSAKNALSIARALDQQALDIDVTLASTAPAAMTFGKNELVVFGAPVYIGRIYRGVLDRLESFCGDQTPCIVTVSYGNRHYDDALLELSDFVSERGFVPVAGAALVARHTYGEIQTDRPDESDLESNRLFAIRVNEKLRRGELAPATLPGNRPYLHGADGGKGGVTHRPSTNNACTDCGLCASLCPEEAIAQDNRTVDHGRCISCFRCIRICPAGAKECVTPAYLEFAERFTRQLAQRRENEYFID
jgi:ferredoxin